MAMGATTSRGKVNISGPRSKSKGANNGQGTPDPAFVEGIVCDESEIGENEMKAFDMPDDGGKVLVVKQGGKLHAIGAKCTHYGAPLVTGVLGNGHVRCPWHGACFNITTGDIEDFPGMDGLPCFQVSTEAGKVKVRAHRDALKTSKSLKTMAKISATDTRAFVVIGGGAAGARAVETLRQEGYTGRLVLISSETWLPYDRIKISKQLNAEGEKLLLRNKAFYDEHAIEVKTGATVTSVDTSEKQVKFSSGETLCYSKLLIASGAKAVQPSYPGSDYDNIYTLRSVDDGNLINRALTKESNVVVIGSSFIGMEAAAFCVNKVNSVIVVGRGSVPFEPVLGTAVGGRIKQLYEEKGVQFALGSDVAKFIGDGTKVTQVQLQNGSTYPADVVIVGIGARPSTAFLKDSGVSLERGAVVVDQYCASNVEDVYAAGDAAYAPVFSSEDRKFNIGHWQLAHYHGHIAAKNMAGNPTELKSIPFFFTMVFGVGVRYSGNGVGHDDVVLTGDLAGMKVIAHYCVGDKVVAVSTIGADPAAAKFAELLKERKPLLKADVVRDGDAWVRAPL